VLVVSDPSKLYSLASLLPSSEEIDVKFDCTSPDRLLSHQNCCAVCFDARAAPISLCPMTQNTTSPDLRRHTALAPTCLKSDTLLRGQRQYPWGYTDRVARQATLDTKSNQCMVESGCFAFRRKRPLPSSEREGLQGGAIAVWSPVMASRASARVHVRTPAHPASPACADHAVLLATPAQQADGRRMGVIVTRTTADCPSPQMTFCSLVNFVADRSISVI